MVTWHRFGQDGRACDESQRWSQVYPGDVVQSRGTLAYHHRDFLRRHDEPEEVNRRILTLHSSPVMVLSRIPGIPGEPYEETLGLVTFLCLSRHGLIVVIQRP